MEYRYACDRCGEIHTSNPHRCRNCGSTVFSPISPETLIEQSSGAETPERIDPDDIGILSTTDPEVEYESSPDVAIDGSIKTNQTGGKVNKTKSVSVSLIVALVLFVVLLIVILIIWAV